MEIASEIIALLSQQTHELTDNTTLLTTAGVISITVVGSLARCDFITGGSDIDLLIVHDHGDISNGEVAAIPAMKFVIRSIGDPVLQAFAHTGKQKPCMCDLHFIDGGLLRDQPKWADPAAMRTSTVHRSHYFWLYAFDLAQHRICLLGPDPVANMHIYPPIAYAAIAVDNYQMQLHALTSQTIAGDPLSEAMVGRWKQLAGAILKLAAIVFGGASLKKRPVLDDFLQRVPIYEGKDFATILWTEYVHGELSLPPDRIVWHQRCQAFCFATLAMLSDAMKERSIANANQGQDT